MTTRQRLKEIKEEALITFQDDPQSKGMEVTKIVTSQTNPAEAVHIHCITPMGMNAEFIVNVYFGSVEWI